jgi:hypothetical protein
MSIQGQTVFPRYASDGSPEAAAMSFLVEKYPSDYGVMGNHGLHEEQGGRWFSIQWPMGIAAEKVQQITDEAVNILSKGAK